MPLEAEQGAFSAMSIMTKECGHFQKEFLELAQRATMGTKGCYDF